MNSHNWSESLLHRFRGRVDAPTSDPISNGLGHEQQHCGSTSITMTTESKKTSMSTTGSAGDGKALLSMGRESLPLIHAASAKDRSTIPRQIMRDFRSRWNRLTVKRRRFILICVLPLVVFHLAAEIIDYAFPIYGLTPEKSTNDSTLSLNVAKTNEFVVVINTYQRPQQLQDAVRHYAETCGPSTGIQTVYIVWAEEGVTPPTPESFFQGQKARKRSAIHVLQVRNSLNSRFLPIPNVQDMAVFMVDDDIRVDCRSLQRGYDAWKANPRSMVGYYPRLSLVDDSNQHLRNVRAPTQTSFIYHSWPIVYWRQKLNFILTKACFLHSHYMSIYSDPNHHPIEVLNYIDQYFNCEDVAMSLLVANITKADTSHIPARPIYVEGNVLDKGLFNGISTGTGHMTQRSKCLRDITAMYISHGWEIPLSHTFSLRESSWRRHRFWWQSQPSNIFEWFALSNIFK
jgi:Glycosyl transferase family 64 domain